MTSGWRVRLDILDRQSVVLILLGQFSSSSRSAHTFMLQPVLSVTY